MKVLLVGDDARAHIIAEQLARSSELLCAMERKNPAITKITEKSFVCDLSNAEAIGTWAVKEKADLAFIINEKALVAGLGDVLEEAGVALASPKSDATVLGTNRIYQKNLVKSAGIACPRSYFCKNEKDMGNAMSELRNFIVKPAFKSGQHLARLDSSFKNRKELITYAKKLIKSHGSVMLETIVDGEEFILQAFSDGNSVSIMPPVQVARRANNAGQGEITNGMGSYSTGKALPFMSERDFDSARALFGRIMQEAIKRGIHYKGVLSAQFVVTKGGVIFLNLENSMGNPETLNNMSLFNTQFVEILSSIADGNLKVPSLRDHATVVKYAVPEKYPEDSKASEININERAIWDSGCKYYINSLDEKKGKFYTTTSRSVAVLGSGATLEEAERRAEAAISNIEGKVRHRSDIASKEFIERKTGHIAKFRRSIPS